MKIVLNRVVKGEKGEHVPETTLSYETGRVTLVAAETAQRPTVLALLATGRMLPDEGAVIVSRAGGIDSADRATAGGVNAGPGAEVGAEMGPDARAEMGPEVGAEAPDDAYLRSATAIVDAPDVSEPVGDLTLKAVVQEELMFAGRSSNRRATLAVIDDLGAAEFAGWELQNVPNTMRVSVLAELAATRPGVEALVLTSPDRRGGDAFEWFDIACDFARRGFAVLVIANQSSVDMLTETAARFDAERQAEAVHRAAATLSAETIRRSELAAEHPDRPAEPAAPHSHIDDAVPVDGGPLAEHPRHTTAEVARAVEPAAPTKAPARVDSATATTQRPARSTPPTEPTPRASIPEATPKERS